MKDLTNTVRRLLVVGNANSIHVRRWVEYFARRRYVVFLVSEHRLEKAPPAGVELFDLTRTINVRKLRYLVWPYLLRTIIRRVQPDIVHAHSIKSAGWITAKCGFQPLVMTAHGSDLLVMGRSALGDSMTRRALGAADRVHCVSRVLFERAVELGFDESRIDLVLLGVDTSVFIPPADGEQTVLRERLGLVEGPTVLLMRGMSPVYRPLDVALMIPVVLESVPEARFVVFTHGDSDGQLEKFREMTLAFHHALNFVDEIDDPSGVVEYMQAADLMVSMAESDGTPISVLESMACGLPVVVSDLPALREWVVDGREGRRVPVGDVKAAAAAVVSLLDTPAERAGMGKKARKTIVDRAEAKTCMAQAERIYDKLLLGE